ncbi:MAG: NUDIX domain-containing protein [Lachnospiraceae bacterium]|nr:NUDIX domain-containing protein [Lachnospiraceae bacterium]
MNGKLRNMTTLYLRSGDKMLLLYRVGSKVVNNSYIGTAGGHFEKDELNDARCCILRELYEETGLKENNIHGLSLRYITLRLKNGEVRQNYYFFADINIIDNVITSNEGKLEWFDISDILNLDMPYTAKFVIKHYLSKGKDNDFLYAGIATDNGVLFSKLNEF